MRKRQPGRRRRRVLDHQHALPLRLGQLLQRRGRRQPVLLQVRLVVVQVDVAVVDGRYVESRVHDVLRRHVRQPRRLVRHEDALVQRAAQVRVVHPIEEVRRGVALLQDRPVQRQSRVACGQQHDRRVVRRLEGRDDVLADVEAVVAHDDQLVVGVRRDGRRRGRRRRSRGRRGRGRRRLALVVTAARGEREHHHQRERQDRQLPCHCRLLPPRRSPGVGPENKRTALSGRSKRKQKGHVPTLALPRSGSRGRPKPSGPLSLAVQAPPGAMQLLGHNSTARGWDMSTGRNVSVEIRQSHHNPAAILAPRVQRRMPTMRACTSTLVSMNMAN